MFIMRPISRENPNQALILLQEQCHLCIMQSSNLIQEWKQKRWFSGGVVHPLLRFDASFGPRHEHCLHPVRPA